MRHHEVDANDETTDSRGARRSWFPARPRTGHLLVAILLPMSVAVGCAEGDNPEPRDIGPTVEPTDTSDASDSTDTAETDVDAGPPEIVPAPSELLFDGSDGEGVPEGDSQTIEIDLQNNGGSTATVDQLAIQGEDASEFSVDYPEGEVPFDLEAGVFRTIEVTYTPEGKDTARETNLIVHFQGELDALKLPLRSINHYPDIDAPNLIRFGGVEAGSSDDKLVNIYNRGAQALEISDISIPSSSDFSVEFPAAELDPTETLQRDETMQFRAVFSPSNDDEQFATVEIESNDPDEGTYNIDLSGNRPKPCMEVETQSVDFGTLSSEEATREFGILNCNASTGEPLSVQGIKFVTDGRGAFSVRDLPDFPKQISPAQETTFTIAAQLEEPRSARGQLQIRSNDDKKSPVLVEVQAERTE